MGMSKGKKARIASRSSAKSNKNLEALRRAQKIDEILLMGNVQSQAASDSAAEERPAGESHIVDLLNRRMASGKNVFERQAPERRKPAARKVQRKAGKPKKAKKSKKAKRR
jgi:hypothetical protein